MKSATTVTGGVITDNLIFDSNNNVQANPEEIYTLYAGMSKCIEQKARLSSSSLSSMQYNVFAKDCSKVMSNK